MLVMNKYLICYIHMKVKSKSIVTSTAGFSSITTRGRMVVNIPGSRT